ncbi:MAG: ABC transporter permease [Acidimicrobiia bacterium]
MEFLADVIDWFTTASNWTGTTGILNRLFEHVQLSAISVLAASAIAMPLGLILGHTGRGGFVAVSAVNIGRAVPSFAIVALALPITIELAKRFDFISSGLGALPTFLALLALALPPIFTNTYTGIREVDRDMVEAARGMGMKERQILLRIEMPTASPIILAAVRVSAVQVVATATLGALVAWGGLGRFIIDGFAQQDNVEVFAGALLVALLAVLTEGFFALLERMVIPAGTRPTGRERIKLPRPV